MLADQFKDCLGLAERSLRSPDRIIKEFGVQLYSLVFRVFSGSFDRELLINSVLCHIGSQNSDECDAGLEVLLQISENAPLLKKHWHLWKQFWTTFIPTLLLICARLGECLPV